MFQKKTNNTLENKPSSIPFFFGLISGVVAGILLAPTDGKTTRKNLKKSVKSLVNTIEESQIGQQVISNASVKNVTENITKVANITNTVKDNVEKKATSILKSPTVKKIVTTSLSDLKPAINKKTGKKFISRKK